MESVPAPGVAPEDDRDETPSKAEYAGAGSYF
jgi:hypothetical protein